MRSFAGGSGGDSGGGDMLMSWTASGSRARPLPLSGLGGAGGGRSSGPGEAVALAVLRWISLRRWAMRSEMLAPRWGLRRGLADARASRGARRGEVVYLSLSSLPGANLALADDHE